MPYPQQYRPVKKSRPKSSEHIHGKRKSWLSDGSIRNDKIDMSPRSGHPWWKSPLMKAERLRRAATRSSK